MDEALLTHTAENFLPQVDGSTLTIAHLLEHLNSTGVQAMLFGPNSGMSEYAGARLFPTFGLPMPAYPGLKANFLSPDALRALREFAPHVIHLVDPICLGVQVLAAATILFPTTPIVTSYHTNLTAYAGVFGYPCYPHRAWQVSAYLHSFARCTLVPSASTAALLAERKFANLRVVSRGVDIDAFNPALRSVALRQKWVAAAAAAGPHPALFWQDVEPVITLCVGRISREKNLDFLVDAFAALSPRSRSRSILVFVGDGPYRRGVQHRCTAGGVRAVFPGHLSGRALGEAFASGDIMVAPSLTETFGQTTLQGMAAGLPVVGLLAEGTADLVVHGRTGLLLDVAAAETAVPWTPLLPLGPNARVPGWGEAAPLLSKHRQSLVAGFARMLSVLTEDGALRCEMGRAGVKAARGGAYEWEQCSRRVVDAYVEAVSTVDAKSASQGTVTLPPLLQGVLDAVVVVFALCFAMFSHAAYFVPTARDLRERGRWGGSRLRIMTVEGA
ncbi:glycosyl transferase group 1 [Mycena filopes]|nr:glycosyl transferase group 1 [Mycena filopes]